MKIKYFILPLALILTIIGIVFIGNFTGDAGVINLDKKVETKIFNSSKSKYLFLFFGYVGCRDVCTPRLEELSDIYRELKINKIDIDTKFINLIKLRDKTLPQLFASSFHSEFDGIYLDKDELRSIKNEFNIYCSKSITESGEWNHSSFLYLLKREKDGYYLRKIYIQTPFDKKRIIKDIKGMK